MQQRSRFPTRAEWEELYKTAPILDDSSAEMRSVCERYIQHRDDLAMAHDAIMHPLPPPSVMEELLLDPKDPIFDEVDPYFFEKDRQDAIRIKKLRDSYYVDGALQDYYNIYGAGAPFERLFFEARRQLQHAIERLGYERAERAYEKEMDPRFDDFNFIEAFSSSQYELRRTNEKLLCAEERVHRLEGELKAKRLSARRWRHKFREVVGNEFADRPASV